MSWLMKVIGGFFDWWEETTGLPYRKYFNGKVGVNWSMVAFVLLMIVLLVILGSWHSSTLS